MKEAGFNPAVIVETSPANYQAGDCRDKTSKSHFRAFTV
jgi:hypothetical protein